MGKFDNILDDVVVNAKAAASAVSKKASSVYDASKQKISAAEVRGEINKKLKDLGALTYKAEVHNLDLSKEIADTIAEINNLKESLEIINEHIAAAKNQRKCPSCDASVPKNSIFCNICGAKLEEDVAEEQTAEEPIEQTEETPVEEAVAETAEEEVAEKPAEPKAETEE